MKNSLVLYWTTILLLLLTKGSPVNCGRILVISPAPLYSHQSILHGLCRTLSKRGHEVVLITSMPKNDPSYANYTEVDISYPPTVFKNSDRAHLMTNFNEYWKYQVDNIVFQLFDKMMEYFYDHPEVKKIYKFQNDHKFDVVIAEGLTSFATFAMSYLLKAPLIAVIPTDIHMYHNHLLGSPILPSHPSNWEFFDRIKPEMSFWDRLQNFFLSLFHLHHWYHYQTGPHEQIIKNIIGHDVPPLYDIAKNMSLLMVNYDPLLGYARPLPPNVVLFSGLHIEESSPPLSKEIKEFLESGSNGFIYMSLGCNMRSSILPHRIIRAMYNVFSRLPYKVLWKFETDDIPRRNANILTSNWFPQQTVLAHPNIKLFILQGGMQSSEEAVYYGMSPIVGVPIMFEQAYRIEKLVSLGVGRMLDLAEINEGTFHEVIHDVLANESYRTRMAELSRLMKDRPYNSKNHVAWWVEYVMRHKGAPHLRFDGSDEPWYQRFDMDIVAFLSIICFVVTAICATVLLRCSLRLYKYRGTLYSFMCTSSIHKRGKIN